MYFFLFLQRTLAAAFGAGFLWNVAVTLAGRAGAGRRDGTEKRVARLADLSLPVAAGARRSRCPLLRAGATAYIAQRGFRDKNAPLRAKNGIAEEYLDIHRDVPAAA